MVCTLLILLQDSRVDLVSEGRQFSVMWLQNIHDARLGDLESDKTHFTAGLIKNQAGFLILWVSRDSLHYDKDTHCYDV